MTKNIQYQIFSYEPFLWWYVATVHFWRFDAETSTGYEYIPTTTWFWFFRKRQPDFVRNYVARVMEKTNTRLRWEQRFLKAKDD